MTCMNDIMSCMYAELLQLQLPYSKHCFFKFF
jgi:hypothetical protein